MLKKGNPVNIPTDILRTVVTISELGSFSKAGDRLGLSQPAISAQIKRMQVLVGGPIFTKSAGGVTLNDRGKLLLPHIRRLLEINDRILGFGGCIKEPRPFRIGVMEMYIERFFDGYDPKTMGPVSVICDHPTELLRGIAEGYLDAACVMKPATDAGVATHQWTERFCWVRSRNFVTSPGKPIPFIGWSGLPTDQIAIGLFEAKGLAYGIAFSSCDRVCRDAAVSSGFGLSLLADWAIPADLVEAHEYYLPAVPPVEMGVVVRHDVNRRALRPVLELLESLGGQKRVKGSSTASAADANGQTASITVA